MAVTPRPIFRPTVRLCTLCWVDYLLVSRLELQGVVKSVPVRRHGVLRHGPRLSAAGDAGAQDGAAVLPDVPRADPDRSAGSAGRNCHAGVYAVRVGLLFLILSLKNGILRIVIAYISTLHYFHSAQIQNTRHIILEKTCTKDKHQTLGPGPSRPVVYRNGMAIAIGCKKPGLAC